jgi:hypothetical protein
VIDVRERGANRISDLNTADGFNAFEVDDTMIKGVQLHLDTVELFTDIDSEIAVEEQVDLSHIDPDCWGTGDVVVYQPSTQELTVVDYKNGRKVVEARENLQLATYAVGAARRLHNRGVKRITLVIVQPNAWHPDGPVRSFTISPSGLAGFETRISDAIAASKIPNAPLVAGEWCHFCPAMAECPVHAASLTDGVGIDLSTVADAPVVLPVVTTLSSAQLGTLYANAASIASWAEGVKKICRDAAIGGVTPAGLKLVHAKRHSRKFLNIEDAITAFEIEGLVESEYMTSKIATPAALEKRLGKTKAAQVMKGLLDERPTPLTLAPLSDPRPAATAMGASFGTVEE